MKRTLKADLEEIVGVLEKVMLGRLEVVYEPAVACVWRRKGIDEEVVPEMCSCCQADVPVEEPKDGKLHFEVLLDREWTRWFGNHFIELSYARN